MRGFFLLIFVLSSAAVTGYVVREPAGEGNVEQPSIAFLPTPDDGIQPRLVNDSEGGLHLLYFKKEVNKPAQRRGNLFYREYHSNSDRWLEPVKVSSEAFAVQSFSIARSSMDIDASGRIHVVWYLPRENEYHYSRSDVERSHFEEQRSLVSEYSVGLDAAADVASKGESVAIIWGAGDLNSEQTRTVYGRFSQDSGATFGPEQILGDPKLGACACCSLAADYDHNGQLQIAYRSAINGSGRHMQFLSVGDNSDSGIQQDYAPVAPLQQWELSACPLSTNDISSNDEQSWLVFESQNKTLLAPLGEQSSDTAEQIRTIAEPLSKTRQKNPSLAVNKDKWKLVAWGEAISHSRGGRLNLGLLNPTGEKVDIEMPEINIPDYSFPAIGALEDGSFVVLY